MPIWFPLPQKHMGCKVFNSLSMSFKELKKAVDEF